MQLYKKNNCKRLLQTSFNQFQEDSMCFSVYVDKQGKSGCCFESFSFNYFAIYQPQSPLNQMTYLFNLSTVANCLHSLKNENHFAWHNCRSNASFCLQMQQLITIKCSEVDENL